MVKRLYLVRVARRPSGLVRHGWANASVRRPMFWSGELQRAAIVIDLHSLHAREETGNLVVIDDFQAELNASQHDVSRAGRQQVHGAADFVFRFDRASRRPSPELLTVGDKAGSVNFRIPGEGHPTSILPENLATLVRAARPGTREIERSGLSRQRKQRTDQDYL